MSILAIDPGTQVSGFVLYDAGEILGSGVRPNAELVEYIENGGAGLTDAARFEGADTLAIEMVCSYGMPVGREVFETVVWIGRFQQAWHSPEEVKRVPRLTVKMHLCGTARAKDPNIWQALLDRVGPVGTKGQPGPLYGVKSHARAALALAMTVADGAA